MLCRSEGLKIWRKDSNIHNGIYLKRATFERTATYILRSLPLDINTSELSNGPTNLIRIISITMILSKCGQ